MKTAITAAVSGDTLLLPELLKRALTANGRVKYLLALLQTARNHADDPAVAVSDLRDERRLCDIDDETLDEVVQGAYRNGEDVYVIPRSAAVLDRLRDELERLLAPLKIAGAEDATGLAADALERRASDLLTALPAVPSNEIPGTLISTRAAAHAGDIGRARHALSPARGRLRRRPGFRVHGAGGQAVAAPDPARQA